MNIVGYSPNFIALLLECYRRVHNVVSEIRIHKNIKKDENDDTPYCREDDVVVFSGDDNDDDTWMTTREWYIGVGQPQSKRSVVSYMNEKTSGCEFPSLIDPSTAVCVAGTASVGRGVVLLENVVLAPFCTVGDFTTVNRQCSIGHHTVIGQYCTLSPGVHIAGHCRIEEGVFIGIGAVVCDHVVIGKGCVIGAGSVVVKSVPAGFVAYGNPARVVRRIE
jgi:sugar O-acyltransferase (sialic acid O-acetyltransferase NeuD family)